MTQNISIALLDYNKGQLKGLPKNPRFFRDYRFEEVRFMYKDTLSGQYICERDNVLRPTKAYKRIYPDTETNRRNANLNIR